MHQPSLGMWMNGHLTIKWKVLSGALRELVYSCLIDLTLGLHFALHIERICILYLFGISIHNSWYLPWWFVSIPHCMKWIGHYDDVTMGAIASQITSLTIVYSTVYSGADQSKHQSSASLAFVWGIHRGPVNSPHKWPVTRKMFPFDDVIMGMEVGLGIRGVVGFGVVGWVMVSVKGQGLLLLIWIIIDQDVDKELDSLFHIRYTYSSQYKDRLIYVWRFPC